MTRTLELNHDYAANPDDVWRVATDFRCLQQAMKGLAVYRGFPIEPLAAGQVIHTHVSLFGLLPEQAWTMEVLEHDPSRRIVRSHEYGGAVRRWDHTLTVVATPSGARLVDRIEIDAGASTGLFLWWAGLTYRRRHRPRLEMLGLS